MNTPAPATPRVKPAQAPKVFILDVDGVMTDGQFYYTPEGKAFKVFGADDNDALSLLKPHMEIRFVTGDKKGWDISHKRIAVDMKYPLDLVSTTERITWIAEKYDPATVVYMGDGIFDPYVFAGVAYSIAPANGMPHTKARAHYVCQASGAKGAVAEACLHLLATFFKPWNPDAPLPGGITYSGSWGTHT